MKQLEPLFGFPLSYDENGDINVHNVCSYPQESRECLKLYNQLQLIKIKDSGITFPVRMVYFTVTVNPIDEDTIKEYFKIMGIKKIVEENKSRLIGKTTFIKPQIEYNKKTKFPNLHVHFYQVVDEGGEELFEEFDLIEFSYIHYQNTKQFTKKRISELEKLLNPEELFQMSFLPIEMVRFNESNNILDFEFHLLALSTAETSI